MARKTWLHTFILMSIFAVVTLLFVSDWREHRRLNAELDALELRVWFNDLVMRELDEEIDRVASE